MGASFDISRPQFAAIRDVHPRAAVALWLVAVGSVGALAATAEAWADDALFSLKGGERIVFFGDSITQAGGYVADVEVFLLTRFPDKRFTIINHGKSSETISGTSEVDHHPRRPDAHQRFARDVAEWKPDVVVACFGMNDGNYHPFDADRFARYQDGIRRLILRTNDDAHARLVLLTPPPFDPYRRVVGDAGAVAFGYKFPAIDYDQTLERYRQWLLTLAGPGRGLGVVDVHGALSEHLKRRRERQVSFFLSADAVHPGPTGHWLIAQTLLSAWHAPAEVAVASIALANDGAPTLTGSISGLVRADSGGVRFVWRTPLPLSVDPAWDRESIELERFADRFNRYRIAIDGLPLARYRMRARLDGGTHEADVASVTREQFERGVDLTALARFPTVSLSREIRERVIRRRLAVDAEWRRRIERDAGYHPDARTPEYQGDDPELAEIRRLCGPRDIQIELVPDP